MDLQTANFPIVFAKDRFHPVIKLSGSPDEQDVYDGDAHCIEKKILTDYPESWITRDPVRLQNRHQYLFHFGKISRKCHYLPKVQEKSSSLASHNPYPHSRPLPLNLP